MKNRIMLDIETLGTRPGSVILSIGAVKFGNDQIYQTFYERIDPQSCVDLGLKMDASTIIWWMRQETEARIEVTKEGSHLAQVLINFRNWVEDSTCDHQTNSGDLELWGNGAGFDNIQLKAAYDAASLPAPWKFYEDRCYRTIKSLHPEIKMNRKIGTHHNALDDAMNQAFHLMDIFKAMKSAA